MTDKGYVLTYYPKAVCISVSIPKSSQWHFIHTHPESKKVIGSGNTTEEAWHWAKLYVGAEQFLKNQEELIKDF
jgi:hypothetical protein